MKPSAPTDGNTEERVRTARESNERAAARNLWSALDTLECGRPEVVARFFRGVGLDHTILDVGCWYGSIAELAAESIRREAGIDPEVPCWRSYTGVDVVQRAVQRFNERHCGLPHTRAMPGDIRQLPVPDDSADVLICLFVLQDMEGYRDDGLKALRELRRVACNGARALIALTVNAEREENTWYVIKKLRREGIPEKPTHHWRRTDFEETLQTEGFSFEPDQVHAFGPNQRGFVEMYIECTVLK